MRACFCSGPRPGETLCPCRLRNESDKDRRLRYLEAEVRRLRTGGLETAGERHRRLDRIIGVG